ncbi:hypothetical protein QN224_13165 [Sinorhizobium sp. 8-89]|uniref:hypothetical protein n=1 Tax=Sinorhizobium sp. 7-81 TaxID=3049087 RepID=UPI0024C3526E|nr:hypothetical protein [Sinorhizobium sp. 7-81]MDK1386359.1 hypothetical protein [Sinorhizobium sp. 7-81]
MRCISVLAALLITTEPVSAAVEAAKPDLHAAPEVRAAAEFEAETPCTRLPPGTILRRWVPSTLRAADGTALAVGSTEVRQRC